jgi:porin
MILASLFFIAALSSGNNQLINQSNHDPEVGAGIADIYQTQKEADRSSSREVVPSPYRPQGPIPNLLEDEKKMTNFVSNERNLLDQHGVDFFLSYTSDIAGNPVGGVNPNGFTYADFLYLGGVFSTQELFGWPPGGSVTMSVAQVDGSSLSQKNIGNQFSAQEIYVGQTFYWYQIFYEQRFWDDHANIKIGRISTGNDFATSPLYWFYMNGGIDGSPQALLVNQGISYYASATWGAVLKAHLSSSTVARIGIYQVTPGSMHGLTWNMYPSDGVELMGQFSWNPEFSFAGSTASQHQSDDDDDEAPSSGSKNPVAPISTKGFKGHYWMGGYYSTSTYNESLDMPQQANSYGLYWHADQTVYRPDPTNNTGLVLWTVFALSPQQNISFMPFQVNGGAVYTGLIPGRKTDATILGIAYGNFSPNFASLQSEEGGGFPTYELVYEAGYRICLSQAVYIQPDVQWIVNPGGTGTIPNALVIGAQMGVTF